MRFRKFLIGFGGIVGILAIAAFFLFVGAFVRSSLLPPFLKVGSISIGLLPRETALKKIETAMKRFEQTELIFAFQGEVVKISTAELGIYFDFPETVHRIPSPRTGNNLAMLIDALWRREIPPAAHFSLAKAERILRTRFSKVKLMEDASFVYDPKTKEIIIQPESEGFVFDAAELANDLEQTIAHLSKKPIFLRGIYEQPLVTAQDLSSARDALLTNLPRRIFLRSDQKKWAMNFPEDIQYLHFERLTPLGQGHLAAPELTPVFRERNLDAFLEEREITKALEKSPEGLKIFREANEKIVFEGQGIDGQYIDRGKLRLFLERSFRERIDAVQIPLIIETAPLEISQDLQTLGIRELVATGYTTFYGSPPNRIHNIGIGVKRFSGLLIPPGSTFSFNENLGPVEGYTGYKPELVIKPDGTKPEYGGGLCQVSTTFYRVALNAGLPIVERSAHSYAVTYYSQVGGHGLDATIYPGDKDLKFLNDTPAHLLVQSFSDGSSATFRLFGTKDARSVSFEGPYFSNYRKPGPDEIIYTTELPEGKKKQEEKPHIGFDALWYRSISKNGETKREEIFSRYKAVSARYLIGGEGQTLIDPSVEAARKFE